MPPDVTEVVTSPAETAEAAPRGSSHPVFTVVTLLRNQAHLLETVWQSLCAQSLQNFEWLIVDDGSSDGADAVARRLEQEAGFPVRYIRQPYRGRHVAWNRAVHLARGEFCVCFDAGDCCAADALECFLAHWNAIPEEARPLFSGITVLSLDPAGQVAGDPFRPEASLASPFVSIARRLPSQSWTALRAEIAKRFLYPVIAGERFLDERIVRNRVAAEYRTCCVNEALRRLGSAGDRDLDARSIANPLGARLYHREALGYPFEAPALIRSAVEFVRFSLHARKRLRSIVLDTDRTLLVLAVFPIGVLKYLHDRSCPKPETAPAAAPLTPHAARG